MLEKKQGLAPEVPNYIQTSIQVDEADNGKHGYALALEIDNEKRRKKELASIKTEDVKDPF